MDRVLDGYLNPMMNFMFEVLRNRNVDIHVRDVALSFVQTVAAVKTKQFMHNKWVQPTLDAIMPMLSEPVEDEDDDVIAPRLCVGGIEVLCAALPDKFIGPIILTLVNRLTASSAWQDRKGALEILAVATGSIFVFMTDHFKDYLHILVKGFSDPNVKVRSCSEFFCSQGF